MVTRYEDKHYLLLDMLRGQNATAGGAHSYHCVLKVIGTTTRNTERIFKGTT